MAIPHPSDVQLAVVNWMDERYRNVASRHVAEVQVAASFTPELTSWWVALEPDVLPSFVMDAFAPGPKIALAALGEDAVPAGALELARQLLK